MVHRSTITKRLLPACALVLAMALPIPPAQASTPVPDQEARNAATVREAFERWADRTGSVFDILSQDIAWTIHGSGPYARTYNGKDSFLEQAATPLTSRLTTPVAPQVHHIWTADDRVVVRFDGTATTVSGGRYENQFVWIFRMENDQVVEAEAFLDLVEYQTVIDNNQPRAQ